MSKDFGTVADYVKALGTVIGEGVPEKHLHLLRAHCKAPGRISTAQRLAKSVGYANYRAANLQYGRFAHRVATELGVRQKQMGFWLFVLVDWAHEHDKMGHTSFVLRKPVIKALRRLGYAWAAPSSPIGQVAGRQPEIRERATDLARNGQDVPPTTSPPGSRATVRSSRGRHAFRNASRRKPAPLVRWVQSDMDGLGHGVQFLHDDLRGSARRARTVAFLEGYGPSDRPVTVRLLKTRPPHITLEHWAEIIENTRQTFAGRPVCLPPSFRLDIHLASWT